MVTRIRTPLLEIGIFGFYIYYSVVKNQLDVSLANLKASTQFLTLLLETGLSSPTYYRLDLNLANLEAIVRVLTLVENWCFIVFL